MPLHLSFSIPFEEMAFSNWDSGLSEAENHTGCRFYDPPSSQCLSPYIMKFSILYRRRTVVHWSAGVRGLFPSLKSECGTELSE